MTTGILVTIPCLHRISVLVACIRTRAPAPMGVRTPSDVCASSLVSFQSRAYALGDQSVCDSEFNPSSAHSAPVLRTGLKGSFVGVPLRRQEDTAHSISHFGSWHALTVADLRSLDLLDSAEDRQSEPISSVVIVITGLRYRMWLNTLGKDYPSIGATRDSGVQMVHVSPRYSHFH